MMFWAFFILGFIMGYILASGHRKSTVFYTIEESEEGIIGRLLKSEIGAIVSTFIPIYIFWKLKGE